MTRYAERTEVAADRSRAEIERTLARYGADQFLYGWDRTQASIGFRLRGRQYAIRVELPDRQEKRFTHHERGPRAASASAALYDQAVRQRWRVLLLYIKATLEMAEEGLAPFEEAFVAHLVLPDGHTAGAWLNEQAEEVYRTGAMPRSLPGLPEAPRLKALPGHEPSR